MSSVRMAATAVVFAAMASAIALACISGCDRLPGAPRDAPAAAAVAVGSDGWVRATFDSSCCGCHAGGVDGASFPLMEVEYWRVASDEQAIAATAHGQGIMMPSFLDTKGGALTGEEIAALVTGMRRVYGNGALPRAGLSGTVVPGDAARGEAVFAAACASCHGAQVPKGSLVDPDYLRLVSDQALWTHIAVGRKAVGMPAWNEAMPGRPTGLSAGEVADVVAWLSSQRPHARGGTK